MALTRDFKATVQARIEADPAFSDALLHEGVEIVLGSDVDTGKSILRDYIKTAMDFEKFGAILSPNLVLLIALARLSQTESVNQWKKN